MSGTVKAGERGVDFSFARPPAARLVELGYTFVVGYISVPPASPAKNITRAQCEEYLAAGLKVLLVWEMSATRANLGAACGATDGAAAKRLADALGYPPDVPIIMADDTDTTGVVAKVFAALKRLFSGGNIDAHEDYCFAALGAIGINGIGEYGDCDILERTRGLWRIGWVPNAWGWSARSRAAADARAVAIGAHVLQRKGFYIDNTWAVDPNEAIADFPAWSTTSADTAPPPPLPIGDDDMATAFIAVTGLPGQYLWTPGTEPIPFTNPDDRDALLKALGIDPATGGTISKEMFDRLSPKPASSNAAGGPLRIEATVTGTAIPDGG